MRYPAAICSDLRDVNSSLCIGHFCTKNAKLNKILQDVYSKRSRMGVRGGLPFNDRIAGGSPPYEQLHNTK